MRRTRRTDCTPSRTPKTYPLSRKISPINHRNITLPPVHPELRTGRHVKCLDVVLFYDVMTTGAAAAGGGVAQGRQDRERTRVQNEGTEDVSYHKINNSLGGSFIGIVGFCVLPGGGGRGKCGGDALVTAQGCCSGVTRQAPSLAVMETDFRRWEGKKSYYCIKDFFSKEIEMPTKGNRGSFSKAVL